MSRTKIQAEANELDMDMDRLVRLMERFAETLPNKVAASDIAQSARKLYAARSDVRDFMHKADREATQ